MKKPWMILLVFAAAVSLTGCGFTGGCDNMCGGSGSYVFNTQPASCCSSLPW